MRVPTDPEQLIKATEIITEISNKNNELDRLFALADAKFQNEGPIGPNLFFVSAYHLYKELSKCQKSFKDAKFFDKFKYKSEEYLLSKFDKCLEAKKDPESTTQQDLHDEHLKEMSKSISEVKSHLLKLNRAVEIIQKPDMKLGKVTSQTELSLKELGAKLAEIGWLKEKENYLEFVNNLLMMSENLKRRRFSEHCPPMMLVKALVTEEKLEALGDDSISGAIELLSVLRENYESSDKVHSKTYEEVTLVPEGFVLSKFNGCFSSKDVADLLKVKDADKSPDNIGLRLISIIGKTKCKQLFENALFRDVSIKRLFWREKKKSLIRDEQHGLGAIPKLNKPSFWITYLIIILHNVLFVPFEIIRLCCLCLGRGKYWFKKIDRKIYTPITYFLADLTNYLILEGLIFAVFFETSYDKAGGLIDEFWAGNVNFTDPLLRRHEDPKISGRVGIVQLDEQTPSVLYWFMLCCLIDRFISELVLIINQTVIRSYKEAYKIKLPEEEDKKKEFNCWRKIKYHYKSWLNRFDLVLIVLMFTSVGINLYYTYSDEYEGIGYFCIENNKCDDLDIDFSLVPPQIIVIKMMYCACTLLALPRMLYSIFIFSSNLGPMLRSIQLTLEDLSKVLAVLFFLTFGFFLTIVGITYKRRDHGWIDEDFIVKTLSTLWDGVMNGKLNFKDDFYKSDDVYTKAALNTINAVYHLLVGLLLLKFLLALINNTYADLKKDKFRDWHFAQFQLLMGYCATHPADCKPFLFPFSIIHTILYTPIKLIFIGCRTCFKSEQDQEQDQKQKFLRTGEEHYKG